MSEFSFSPYTYAYKSILGVQEYINHEYEVNWVSIFTLIMLSYSIPCFFIFLKIVLYYYKNRKNIKKIGLRLEIFQPFMLMQLVNILLIIGEFAMFRIPYTGILSSFCASENPQIMMKFIVFFYYFASYTSQMFTVLFCGLRVAILYSMKTKTTKKMILMFPYLIISVTFCAALPHFLSDGICIQVFEPYPFGSVLIISRFHLINLNYVVPGNVIFTGSVTISIILLNYFVMRKIQERKMLNVSQSSSATLKIEKTLTGTMIILLIPLMINLFVSIGELFHFSFFSYILLFRPLFLDARVHVVTCYFYITHPVFKKPQTQVSASTNFSLVALKTVE